MLMFLPWKDNSGGHNVADNDADNVLAIGIVALPAGSCSPQPLAAAAVVGSPNPF